MMKTRYSRSLVEREKDGRVSFTAIKGSRTFVCYCSAFSDVVFSRPSVMNVSTKISKFSEVTNGCSMAIVQVNLC